MLKIKGYILTPLAQLKYFLTKNNNNKLSSTQKINCAQQSDRRVHSLHCTEGLDSGGRGGQSSGSEGHGLVGQTARAELGRMHT